jgi:APA family basic amino acid/polyamine antiporter
MKMARTTGIALSVLLAIVGFLHQNTVGFENDRTLLYISLGFAVIHLGLFAAKLGRVEDKV